jgi:LPS O-antigen subunit length determinant protein (WzzB/FepE family)
MKNRIESDEIDLIEIIVNIWKNKLKIAAITAIFIIISVGLYFIYKPPLNAKTEILPLTIFENNLYAQYNSLTTPQGADDKKIITQSRLNVINRGYLLNLFLEELRTKDIIIEAIKKYQLINQKKFDNEDEYLEEVEKKALKLDLLSPINVDGTEIGETRLNWTIEFEVNDKDKWEEALSFIEIEINKNIKNYLKLNFATTLDNLKLLDQFKLEDLDLRITNEKKDFDKKMKKFEMDLEFNLEDIKVKIKNAINDYEVETKNRLAFLTEQAAIARTLNIKKNTIESQEFSTQNSVITNVKTDTPYYLRGYEAIEKDIQLIKNRTDEKPFVKGLLDLEKQKRDLEEDKTLERAERNKVFLEKILALNNAKRDLLENKLLDRTEKLFNNTPIVSSNDFKAANIIYQDTEFKASFSLIKAILFSGIFGIIFGMIYALVSNAIHQRK